MSRKRRTKSKVNYGLQATGTIRIFRKDRVVEVQNTDVTFTDTWFNVSTKISDGEYDNVSMKIIFAKDDDKPDNNELITIKDSWFMLNGQGEYQKIALFVKDWDYTEGE